MRCDIGLRRADLRDAWAQSHPSPRRQVKHSLSRKSPFLPELFPSTIDYADLVFAREDALLGEGSYGQARAYYPLPTCSPLILHTCTITCLIRPSADSRMLPSRPAACFVPKGARMHAGEERNLTGATSACHRET